MTSAQKPPSSPKPSVAAPTLWTRLRTWRQDAWQQSLYLRAQHGRTSSLARRLGVDLALLGGAALIPLAILFWSAESAQKQFAYLPLKRTSYVERWQMLQTHSQVFFNPRLPKALERPVPHPLSTASEEDSDATATATSSLWSFRCGRFYETLSARRPLYEQEEGALPTRHLQCDEGAQADFGGLTLTSESLLHAKEAYGYRLTTALPILVQHGAVRLSSLGGGRLQANGAIRLFRDISFQAPRLQISAQGEFLGLNFVGKNFSKQQMELLSEYQQQKGRILVFKRDVTLAFRAPSGRYRGEAQLMRLFLCSETSQGGCRVFGSDALRKVELVGSVVVAQTARTATLPWRLQAERVVVQDERVHYRGENVRGRFAKARILLADGTMLTGRKGIHEIDGNNGWLCGDVEIRSGEGILKGKCLRYNLTTQRYRIESSPPNLSARAREPTQRFVALWKGGHAYL